MILNNHQPRLLPISSGGEICVTPVPLRRDDPSSPWCYAASLSPPIQLDDEEDNSSSAAISLPPGSNFLATQVWPSSRIASTIIENTDRKWTVCEVGCGPGLPSLTAAKNKAHKVIATDVDELALELVRAAAVEQGFVSDEEEIDEEERFVTMQFDLTSQDEVLPKADLYILSDVFESSTVAKGAAWHVQSILSNNRKIPAKDGERENTRDFSRVWVFAQSDRAQRDAFLDSTKEWYTEKEESHDMQQYHLDWTQCHEPKRGAELWLFDLDETMVAYN